jgi:hypothetical protein
VGALRGASESQRLRKLKPHHYYYPKKKIRKN